MWSSTHRQGSAGDTAGPARPIWPRSLLIAVLGPKAKCPECQGTRQIVWPEGAENPIPFEGAMSGTYNPESVSRCWCDGGYRSLPYQAFKFDVVARWPQSPGEWRMSRSEILAWCASQPDLDLSEEGSGDE